MYVSRPISVCRNLLFISVLLILFANRFSFSQGIVTGADAAIRGVVTDSSGAAISGAQITLTGRKEKETVTTDATGNYILPRLAGGTYTLAVEAAGFGRYENSSIQVVPNSTLEWAVKLAVQSASLSITVQANTEALEQVPTVGKTSTMIQDIPQSISVVSHALSDSQGDLSLHDTVRNASGIIQGGADGFGFADRFQIRGLEARIYNDGFSDGDERNGIPHSLNGVERVEVLEGPGSSLFGSGPPGGTVNLVHYTPSSKFDTGGQFQMGSFGLYSGSAFINGAFSSRWDYRIDGMAQHADGYRALAAGDYEVRPVVGFTTSHNVLLLTGDGRYIQATPDPAGLIYVNHAPITSVPRDTKYSTPFGYGNQAIGRFTVSDVWQAEPFVTVNNRISYMYRNLSILRNGDGGSVAGDTLTGRSLRNQHDVINDLDYEIEPVWNFRIGSVRNTLLTGFEVQHQGIDANRATANLPDITNIFDPVIPETSAASLVFLRDAKHSGFIDDLHANYEGLYATDQLDLTPRLKVRLGVRQDWWQTSLAPQINVPGRSLGNGVLIEPPNVYRRTDTPVSWNVGSVYRVLPGVSAFFGAVHSNLANFSSEATQNGVQAPESGMQYEAGFKVAAFNNRVLLTAAAFHVMRNNVFSLVNDLPVFNNQRTVGADGSVQIALLRHWRLNANVTGMHASLTHNPSSPVVVGNRPQGVPNRIINLWTSYDLLVAHQLLTLGTGLSNRSSMFADLLNTNSVPSYTTADATATLHLSRWTAEFGVRNLTDGLYFTATNGVGGFVGDARSYFAKLQYQFGGKR
jgi:iron complex outermembrane receptor protein